MKFPITSSDQIIWVKNAGQLVKVCQIAQMQDSVGIDLESDSMYRYYHRISLMQLAIGDKAYLIDIPNIGLIKELRDLLLDENTIKVFQDMQYDIALMNTEFDISPKGLFDISIGDRLLKQSHNLLNMRKLVKKYLGIDFIPNKSSQKSNWSDRPLSSRQKIYAANDVLPLVKIKDEIIDRMDHDYKIACLNYYLEHQEPVVLDRMYNIESMWKVKGINKLSQEELYRFRILLNARNEYGQKVDRPIHWVARETNLLKIVKTNPSKFNSFLKLFTNSNKPSYFQKQAASYLFEEVTKSQYDGQVLEKPENGVTLQKWIENSAPAKVYNAHPDRINLFREWSKLCAKGIELPRSFVIDKSRIPEYAVYDRSELQNKYEFPGIVPKLQGIIFDSLIRFIEDATYELTTNELSSEFKS